MNWTEISEGTWVTTDGRFKIFLNASTTYSMKDFKTGEFTVFESLRKAQDYCNAKYKNRFTMQGM